MTFVTRGTELYFFFHFLTFSTLRKGLFTFFKQHLKEEPLAAKTLHGFAIRGHGVRFAGCSVKIKTTTTLPPPTKKVKQAQNQKQLFRKKKQKNHVESGMRLDRVWRWWRGVKAGGCCGESSHTREARHSR